MTLSSARAPARRRRREGGRGWLGLRRSPCERALRWIDDHLVEGPAIIVHTKTPVPYPEVTGYLVPTLYAWDRGDLARACTHWLMSVQLPDGGFPAPDGVAYTFDTGQVMRGLCAACGDVPGAEESLARAADWVLTQVDEDSGRLGTPSTELWTDIANDLIHTYVLPPLVRAGEQLGEPRYAEAAAFVLAYYKAQEALVPFNRLSHFHAYAMEALCELGERDLAAAGMSDVAGCQRADGSVPGYPDVGWVCSTGLAQYAVVWYHLGEGERAARALRAVGRLQNRSGGFLGSYGPGASYIPGAEISWAVKYFLDAHALADEAQPRDRASSSQLGASNA